MDWVSKKSDKAPIALRVTIDRKPRYHRIGYDIEPKQFSKGRVKAGAGNSQYLNKLISRHLTAADGIIIRFASEGKDISHKSFKVAYDAFKNGEKPESFFQYAWDIWRKEGKRLAPSTTKYRKSILKTFAKWNSNLLFSDITYRVLENYREYLMTEKEPQLLEVSANNHLKAIRHYICEAIKDEKLSKNPFDHIKMRETESRRTFLDEEEITSIMEVDLPPYLDRVRWLYLFQACTGLRYSDLMALQWKHIIYSSKIIDLSAWKTKKHSTVPLITYAQDILKRQERKSDYVFKTISNQKYNEYLHEIEALISLKKSLTTHTARHTFATMAITNGIPLEVVASILGVSLRTVRNYAKIIDARRIQEMQKMDTGSVFAKKSA